jgi:hypothetical protein
MDVPSKRLGAGRLILTGDGIEGDVLTQSKIWMRGVYNLAFMPRSKARLLN